jgi:hypothetical protein
MFPHQVYLTHIRLVPCTETGQNEVPKHTTEEVQGANPGLLLFENQKNLGQQLAGLLYKKPRMHMPVVVKCT